MPDNFKHNVPTLRFGQATLEQCWYAAFRMMYAYHKRNENEIQDRLKSVIDFPKAMKEGLLDTDYKKCAQALDLGDWPGTKFNGERGFWDIGLTDGAEAFLEELKKAPLWVSRYVKKGTYHIVVATGYDDRGSGYIIHNNPFPGPTHAVEVTDITANHFVRHITNARGSVMGGLFCPTD